jgi:hypothetical protein
MRRQQALVSGLRWHQEWFDVALAQIAFGRPQEAEAAQTDGLIIEQESSTQIRRDAYDKGQ